MPFGVVNGVSSLDGIHVPQEEGEVWGFFGTIGLNGVFLTEMYSTGVFPYVFLLAFRKYSQFQD